MSRLSSFVRMVQIVVCCGTARSGDIAVHIITLSLITGAGVWTGFIPF